MPRTARKNSKSNFYHIMVQGINKEYIFNTKENIETYRKLIKDKLENSNIIILAYCIMNNHTHFLIYSEKEENLSKYMQRLNTSYSRLYNKKNKRIGFVFRDRFRSQDILSEKQLYNCLIYIHNNPVKAGIVKTMSEYEYSSYNEFLGEKSIITTESLQLLFGNNKNYKEQFMLLHNKYIDEDFINEYEEKKSLSHFIEDFEKKYNIKIEEVIHDKNLLRLAVIAAREQTNATIKELAEKLNISKSTIGRYAKKN